MKLLLLSNSSTNGTDFLTYAEQSLTDFFNPEEKIAFIPYAAVNISYDEYFEKVRHKFNELRLNVIPVHNVSDPKAIIKKCDAIITGGGNTFYLLQKLRELRLLRFMRKQVLAGKKYAGWSAGSNITCPTIMTTNDMPVVQVKNFRALNLIPFQINPHYNDITPENFGGETREQRINEFTTMNKDVYVVGLRENTMLHIDNRHISLKGNASTRIFKYGIEPLELNNIDKFDFLMQ